MRKEFWIGLAGFALVGAAPANAGAAAATADSTKPAAAAAKPAKMVCKYVERTGSNVRERICLSKTDWARVEKHLQESF